MRSLVDDELRIAETISLNFLLAVGGVGTVVFLYTAVTGAGLVSTVFPVGVIEFLLLGVPALGLLYAGYWLRSAAFTPAQVWRIGQYALTGAVLAVLFATAVAAQVPDWPGEARSLLFLLVSTGTEGALVGVLAGTFAAADLLGRELDRHRTTSQEGDITAPDGTAAGSSAPDGPGGPDGLDEPDTPGGPTSTPRGQNSSGDASDARDGRAAGTDGTAAPDGEPTPEEPAGVGDDRASGEVDDLLASLSHDLRNPLNVARLRVELARDEGDLEHLDAVVRCHDRMEALIDETLCLARQDEGSLDVEPVPLRAAAEDAWRNVETGDAALVVATDRTLTADRGRLARLLENLFRNAVEHSSTGSPAEPHDSAEGGAAGGSTELDDANERGRAAEEDAVTVRVGALEGGFYVADDGPGIPPERRETVFQTGYSTRDGGTGLGLAIASRIAGEHGWDVRATESSDGGARFEVTGVRPDERTGG